MSCEMEAISTTAQAVGEAAAQITKMNWRTKRWHSLSDKHKHKMLENLAKGRKIQGDKYNMLKIRKS